MILRTAKNILTRPTDAHLADTARMLSGVIMAMRKIKRDELRSVIEKTQAACEALLDRQWILGQRLWIDRFHPHGVKQHTAFAASNRAEVDAFHAAALKTGSDEWANLVA
jgi:hypothetical protein